MIAAAQPGSKYMSRQRFILKLSPEIPVSATLAMAVPQVRDRKQQNGLKHFPGLARTLRPYGQRGTSKQKDDDRHQFLKITSQNKARQRGVRQSIEATLSARPVCCLRLVF
ncbi:hypothetical protein ACVW1C_002275 [Bradyrhizobium sp. USDA 4011]